MAFIYLSYSYKGRTKRTDKGLGLVIRLHPYFQVYVFVTIDSYIIIYSISNLRDIRLRHLQRGGRAL